MNIFWTVRFPHFYDLLDVMISLFYKHFHISWSARVPEPCFLLRVNISLPVGSKQLLLRKLPQVTQKPVAATPEIWCERHIKFQRFWKTSTLETRTRTLWRIALKHAAGVHGNTKKLPRPPPDTWIPQNTLMDPRNYEKTPEIRCRISSPPKTLYGDPPRQAPATLQIRCVYTWRRWRRASRLLRGLLTVAFWRGRCRNIVCEKPETQSLWINFQKFCKSI